MKLDACNYDTIPKAQTYLALLDELEKAFKEHVTNVMVKLDLAIFSDDIREKKIGERGHGSKMTWKSRIK